MTIPELTEEQRIESYMNTRLGDFDSDARMFTKKELAIFCLKEIDYACEIVKNTTVEEVEEQLKEEQE